MSKLSALSPQEIDAQLFPLWADRYRLSVSSYALKREIAATIFPKARVYRDDRRNGFQIRPLNKYEFERVVQSYDEQQQKLAALAEQIAPFEAEYDKRPWQRYVLVSSRTAKAGHLHYRGCHTLRPTTQCLVVIDASGFDAEQVVGTFGETACSHCFPDAPTVDDPNRTPNTQGEEQVKNEAKTDGGATPAPVVEKTKPVAKKTAKSFTEKPSNRKEIDLDRAARRYNAHVSKIEQLKRQLEAARSEIKSLRGEVDKRAALVPNAEIVKHDVEADHVMLAVRFYENGATS